MRTKSLPTFFSIFKCLVLILALGFLASRQASAQLYRNNFNDQNLNTPETISDKMDASWSSTGGSLYFRGITSGGSTNYGAAILGHNHTYILTLKMDERYQAEITSISFKKLSADNGSFQIKINDVNYGASIPANSSLLNATRTQTVSNLRNTITIKFAVTNTDTRYQNYSHIDDLVINGTVSSYDPAAEATPNGDGVLFVNKNVSTPGNGGSWNNALGQLHYALDAARNKPEVKEIWVASGEYQPETNGGYFEMVNGVKLFGGFYGDEESRLDYRNIVEYRTVLKGRGNTVIFNNNIDNTARLEGFYISEGNGFSDGNTSFGGGMYNVNSSPVITNCVFLNNKTDPNKELGKGGAIYNLNSGPNITQCLFYLNEAKGSNSGAGGAIFNESSSPVLTNCTITENTVNGSNTAGSGGAIGNTGSASPVIRNAIIWNNYDPAATNGFSSINSVGTSDGTPVVSYSLIQGGFAGGTNIIDADPQFENTFDRNYTQRNTSPAINKGDPATDLSDFPTGYELVQTDMSAQERSRNGRIDLGVFEVVPAVKWRVNAASTAENPDGLSWEAAFPTLQEALNAASPDDEIWVAKGEYQPGTGESFSLIHGVKFYGGFNGDESSPDERPMPVPRGNVPGATILKGNEAPVIYNFFSNLDTDDILDGFTIKGGKASSGGGMYLDHVGLTISNCAFLENEAQINGGGLYVEGGSVQIINTIFSMNKALNGSGGGLYHAESYSESRLINCLFNGNTATEVGGGISNAAENLYVMNTTITKNTAPAGGGLALVAPGGMNISNTIVSGNNTGFFKLNAEYSVVTSIMQGLPADENLGVLDGGTDPQFVNPEGNDFRLKSCSPAINHGFADTSFPAEDDLDGNARFFNKSIDMGAYEFQALPLPAGLPSDDQSVSMFVFAGVTAFTKDCQTLAVLEPTSEEPIVANIAVTTHIAGTPTLTAAHKVFVKRYVDITPVQVFSGESAFNVTLFFTKQEFDDYNDAYGNAHNASLPAKLKVVAFHGTSPTGLPDSYSGEMEVIDDVEVTTLDNGNIYAVKFAATEFSGFFISGQSEGALPVTLTLFEATRQENSAFLTWQTSSEVNSAAFELQHSTNGKTWNLISRIAASGTSASSTDYSYTHLNPENGSNFYRLRMLDLDGSFTYSTIRDLRFDHIFKLSVYPNPAVNNITIKGISLTNIKEITLYSLDGHVAYVSKSPGSEVIDVSGFPGGVYMAVVTQKDGSTQSCKVSIRH
ncbi:T9SS type A sorting domain-containing protein [Dyadobacter aurulentus]|uniref:T9SS type A sorting domain-containing protein n=1 Tax=Dyadobacter sp. UC 10 TaxID=2605428 RepID=UPI0011F10EAF|nr:T9SS type A sorting domain-containing protein [Dyadobacter sp. UC 10]KAA0993524.1 T9SS type A sorting domain-containing protein [Dyadobacter sp. UC 10]